ncbi:MAG: hypothetical protein ACW967_09985 [Candidatus Hodarchaeales archaeon]|jgi:hypothetical protein
MNKCQAEDCPSKEILYEKLNRLTDGLLVCPFCFTRLIVSEKTFDQKEIIKKPQENFVRIPVTDKESLQFSELNNEDITLIKPLKSLKNDLDEIKLFISSLDISPEIKNIGFESFSLFKSSLNPLILRSPMNSLLIYQSFRDSHPLQSPLEDMLDLLFFRDFKKPFKIKFESIKNELNRTIQRMWKFEKSDFEINLIDFKNKLIPIKHFIDFPEYSALEKSNLIKDLSVIWLLWICGYRDILDSLFIEFIEKERSLNLVFVSNANFGKISSKESEKSLFQDFALYLPYLLDNYIIFKEEMIKLKEKIKDKLKDQKFKDIFNHFNQKESNFLPIFDF